MPPTENIIHNLIKAGSFLFFIALCSRIKIMQRVNDELKEDEKFTFLGLLFFSSRFTYIRMDKQHKQVAPDSKLRIIFWTSIIASVTCFVTSVIIDVK